MHRKIANGKILEILFEMYMMPYVPVGIKETKKKKKNKVSWRFVRLKQYLLDRISLELIN